MKTKILILVLLQFLILNFQFVIILAQPVQQEWVQRFSWNNTNGGTAISVKLDSIGNVYVLSKRYTDSTFGDFGLIKYNNSGILLWDAFYNSPGNLNDQPWAFVVSGSGDVPTVNRLAENSISVNSKRIFFVSKLS